LTIDNLVDFGKNGLRKAPRRDLMLTPKPVTALELWLSDKLGPEVGGICTNF
jgi:hypothetical protein